MRLMRGDIGKRSAAIVSRNSSAIAARSSVVHGRKYGAPQLQRRVAAVSPMPGLGARAGRVAILSGIGNTEQGGTRRRLLRSASPVRIARSNPAATAATTARGEPHARL